jgi:hypothetical protein
MLVNFDQFDALLSLNTGKRQYFNPYHSARSRPALKKGLLKRLFSSEIRENGDTHHSVPKSGLGSRQSPRSCARGDFRDPCALAIETIAA